MPGPDSPPRPGSPAAVKDAARPARAIPTAHSALGQAATGAVKTATFLGEGYRRLIRCMPKGKARVALARSILVIIFALLAGPMTRYRDLGSDFCTRHLDTRRCTDQLVRQLEALGHQVSLAPAAWPAVLP